MGARAASLGMRGGGSQQSAECGVFTCGVRNAECGEGNRVTLRGFVGAFRAGARSRDTLPKDDARDVFAGNVYDEAGSFLGTPGAASMTFRKGKSEIFFAALSPYCLYDAMYQQATTQKGRTRKFCFHVDMMKVG